MTQSLVYNVWKATAFRSKGIIKHFYLQLSIKNSFISTYFFVRYCNFALYLGVVIGYFTEIKKWKLLYNKICAIEAGELIQCMNSGPEILGKREMTDKYMKSTLLN